MPRYFIEVAYKGTQYGGFQIQQNANTIQAEIEKAYSIIQRKPVSLTGSSRTDAGVHALQNYFHFDSDVGVHPQLVYKMNALLPPDIAVRAVVQMPATAHARFDAVSREYQYRIHRFKDPFLQGASYFFPYKLDRAGMQEAAAFIKTQTNFLAFSKTNTQVSNFLCSMQESHWQEEGEELVYTVKANRFLRGMVRLLTGTMLKVGRGKMTIGELKEVFAADQRCGYSVPAHGLYLKAVAYPYAYFV